MKLINLVKQNKYWLPTLAITGNFLLSPLAAATIYSSTVDLNVNMLQNGDSVVTTDSIGFLSNNAALQLGTGAISVDINAATPNQIINGASLNNNSDNDFGIGSSIKIVQTIPNIASYGVYGIHLYGNTTDLSASALVIDINAQDTAIGIKDSSNNVANINLGDNTKINVISTDRMATGIILENGGNLTTGRIDINTVAKGNTYGLSAYNGAINLGSGSTISIESLTNGSGAGIQLRGNSTLDTNNLSIKTKNGHGIYLNNTSHANLGQNSVIDVTGNQNSGVAINGTNVNFDASSLTIKVVGNTSHGLDINNGANRIDLGSGSNISVNGDNSIGIWLVGQNHTLLTANALTIDAKGTYANGLEISRGSAVIGSGSVITSEKAAALVVDSASSGGAPTSATINDSKLISYGYTAASAQGNTASVNLNNVEVVADRNGAIANAVRAIVGGVVNANNLKVEAASNVNGLYANSQGKILLQGTTIIDAQDTAILADNLGSVTGNSLMAINGNLVAKNSGVIDLVMTSGSSFNGAANQQLNGILNLNMTDSHWKLNNNSSVNNLSLANNSLVDFTSTTDGLLTITHLSGNGLFSMRADIVNNSGDLIDVTGTTTGNHKIGIQNNGSSITDGSEILTLVKTADGLGNFSLTNSLELGGYIYDLRQSGNNWELYSSRKTTSAANASGNLLNVSYMMNYAETQTLLQRMGELRQSNSAGDVWARTFYGNFNSFSNSKLSEFDMRYSGLQFGVDKIQSTAGGNAYYGVFGGLSDSDQDFDNGSGSLKSKSVGIYGSYQFNSGAYIDAVLKYQHHKNDLTVYDTQGNVVRGNGSTDGVNASIEAGHRLFLDTAKTGFYIEPQLQLSYGWQNNSTINNSNGLKVKLDSYNSLLGRAGTLVGYEVSTDKASSVNFYVKNSWLHEFSGDTSYTVNTTKEKHKFKGDAWVSGVGTSVKVANNHIAYFDMEKTTGNKFNQNQINVGYRYSF